MINKKYVVIFPWVFLYSTLTAEFGRAFRKGWVEEAPMQLLRVIQWPCVLGSCAFLCKRMHVAW